MKRRLYFLLPDVTHTLTIIEELSHTDIDMQLHIKAGEGIDRSLLPEGLQDIQRDTEHMVEHILWNINILIFFVALLSMILSIIMGWNIIAMTTVAIMAISFTIGLIDITLPDVKLSDFDHALSHSEILLMIDTTRSRIKQIEDMVHRHHPEVVASGVSWHLGFS